MSALGRMRTRRAPVRRPTLRRVGLRRPRLPRLRPRTLVAVVLLAGLLVGGWMWLRGSSLVSVDHVTVTGLSESGSGPIRAALTRAGRSMTTLEVNMPALQAAVAPYPVVKSLQVSAEFPHGLRIRVNEEVAVGAVSADGRRTAVAGDGTLLPSVSASGLPTIVAGAPSSGGQLTGPTAHGAAALLAAAPEWLRDRVSQVTSTAADGLVADLRVGPQLRFGAATQLAAKWQAVADTLANASSEGASYIDVSVPERPAAGGVPGGATADSSVASGTTLSSAETGVSPAIGTGG